MVCDLPEKKALPDHLSSLPGGGWALWRWAGLRGAGFPVEQVLNLADSECAAAADRLSEAEEEALQLWEAVLEAVSAELERADSHQRPLFQDALRKFKKGRLQALPEGSAYTRDCIERLGQARLAAEQALLVFQEEFHRASETITRAIRELALTDAFREAVTWQNRKAVHTAIEPLLRKTQSANTRGSKQRQYEQLIANYLQRYCVKNDTIGFFGPVGWARFVPETDAISVKPGPTLLSSRNLYFESWCIDTLAEIIARDKSILRFACPRRICMNHIEGQVVHRHLRPPLRLSAVEMAVVNACDGEQTAKDIAIRIASDSLIPINQEEEVYKLMESLQRQGILWWELEAPPDIRPERSLKLALERIKDDRLREQAMEPLRRLEDDFLRIARSTGNAEMLDRALESLESTFKSLTGKAPTRAAGKTYAGRTLVYEDCRRDLEMEIGSTVIESLGPALSLLLTSARWLSSHLAKSYRRSFLELFSDLQRSQRSQTVNMMDFWAKSKDLFFDDQYQIADPVALEFQRKWAEILSINPDAKQADYTCERLRPLVDESFSAPDSGWMYAQYHSPDVMIAAPSVEAIKNGDYQLVLGELHVGVNTLSWPLFLCQHPSPGELFTAIDQDMPEPRLIPIIHKQLFGAVTRVQPALISPKDFLLEIMPGPSAVPSSRTVPMGSLVIERKAEELIVKTRDGALQFDIIEAFGELLSTVVGNRFKILRPQAHLPRVTVGNLVVCRESWSFPSSEMEFAFFNDESERFVSARSWASLHNLPRFVFVKVPVEIKPFYLDFYSPIYVDIFTKMIRRTAESGLPDQQISMTEMLPRADQTWLPGPDGRGYTSELRIIALDLLKGRA
jgi:hypothetical protein